MAGKGVVRNLGLQLFQCLVGIEVLLYPAWFRSYRPSLNPFRYLTGAFGWDLATDQGADPVGFALKLFTGEQRPSPKGASPRL